MHKTVSVVVATLFSGLFASSAMAEKAVPIRLEPVAKGVTVLYGKGGNIAVSIGADGVVMVDDQYSVQSENIRQALTKLTDQPVKFLINTHFHFDHTGGNEIFGKANAVLVAHDNVRKRLAGDQFIEYFKKSIPASPSAALPVVTFNDSVSFHLNGGMVKVTHVPHAHTDGDAIVHFVDANVIHMGDIFFNGIYPFIDIGNGGNLTGVIAAVESGLALAGPATVIIPGHGEVTDTQGLRRYLEMLKGIHASVAGMIKAGASKEAVVAANPTAAFDAQWGGGFVPPAAMAGFAYDSLTHKH